MSTLTMCGVAENRGAEVHMYATAPRSTLSCEAVTARLFDCVDGDLVPAGLEDVEVHLTECDGCVRLARELIQWALAVRSFGSRTTGFRTLHGAPAASRSPVNCSRPLGTAKCNR